jgi:addiction module RelE/StbE family toxin
MNIFWSLSFKGGSRKTVNKAPELSENILDTIKELKENPFSSNLKTHKLKGELEGCYACSFEYKYRIVFSFVQNALTLEDEILLIDIGTHDEVY